MPAEQTVTPKVVNTVEELGSFRRFIGRWKPEQSTGLQARI
jgi:hypothetical protein